jgi:ribosomal protein S18 acetylase RimI-like enzyme
MEMTGIHDAAEEIEKQAWADLVSDAAPETGRVYQVGGAVTLVCPGVDGLLLNRALGVRPSELDAVINEYARAGVERFFIHGMNGEDLEAKGLFRYPRSWIKVARSGATLPAAMPSCPYRIAPADAADAGALGRILGEALDVPEASSLFARTVGRDPWHAYVARHQGSVVAAGLLFVSDGVGYLAGGATDPAHRRRGAQSALLAVRVRRAVELGCRVIFSETGERVVGEPNSSYDNMLRQGFQPICRRTNWAPKGITWNRSVA